MSRLWSELISGLAEEWIFPGSLALLTAVALLLVGFYWTRLGESHLLSKCVGMALLIHALACLGVMQLPPPPLPLPPPEDERITIDVRDGPGESTWRPLDPLAVPMEEEVREDQLLAKREDELLRLDRMLPESETEFDDPLPDPDLSIDEPPPQADPSSTLPQVPLADAPEQDRLPTPAERTLPKERLLARSEASTRPQRTWERLLTREEIKTDVDMDLPEQEDAVATARSTPAVPAAPAPDAVKPRPSDRPSLLPVGPRVARTKPTEVARARRENLPRARRPPPTPAPTRSLPAIDDDPPPPVASTPPPAPVTAASPAAPMPAQAPPESRFDLDVTMARRRDKPQRPSVVRAPRQIASLDIDELIERQREGFLKPEGMGGFWDNRLAPNRLEIVFRHGGSEATERAVGQALEWLAAHQSADGRWDSDGFPARCPDGDICEGIAIETQSDTGLTGLSLLAFLGAGHTHLQSPTYRETVRRGLSWLLRVQRADGDLQFGGRIYCHSMATLALCEAFAMSKDERLREPAQRATTWLARAQHAESGGWRYGPNQFGDTSVFGWAILALKSAQTAGLNVPEVTWKAANRWLPLVSSGARNGLASYRPGYEVSHAMTAEALFCRQVLGQDLDPAMVQEASDYVLSRFPDPADYHLYYWYYGTLALFQIGGSPWERWNDQLTATLLATQRTTGHQRGSWDPERPFGVDGGRIFATAGSALCLEVYYRYLPLYRTAAPASP